MKNEEYLQEVQLAIGAGDLEEAIGLFLAYFTLHPNRQEGHDAILIQSGRFMQLKRDRESGTLDSRQFNLELNSIRKNILSLVRKEEIYLSSIKNASLQVASKEDELVQDYLHAWARLQILSCLLNPKFVDKGLDIGSLAQISQLKKRKQVVAVLNELELAGFLDRYRNQGLTHNRLSPLGIKRFKKFQILLDEGLPIKSENEG